MKYITIHCAATPNGKYFDAQDIDDWHKERGFLRTEPISRAYNPDLKHIGYHFVILCDGTIQTGRAVGERGAHVEGANTDNVGICLIGTDKFSAEQWNSLNNLCVQLRSMDRKAQIKGHYEFPSAVTQGKTCPNFDVRAWVDSNGVPPDDHIL